MNKKILLTLFVFFWGLGSLYSQTTVYLKPDEALKLIFKDSQEVIKEDHPINDSIQQKAKSLNNSELPKKSYSFYLGKTNGKVDGYALIDEQLGKALPITFITKLNTQGQVEQVEIMVYRESHGGEVASKRFLNQFKDKRLNDELRLHGTITHVTGATISSQALVIGVKRALTLWQIFYGPQ